MVQESVAQENNSVEETLDEEVIVDEASEMQNLESLDETLGSVDETLSRCSSREFNKVTEEFKKQAQINVCL